MGSTRQWLTQQTNIPRWVLQQESQVSQVVWTLCYHNEVYVDQWQTVSHDCTEGQTVSRDCTEEQVENIYAGDDFRCPT